MVFSLLAEECQKLFKTVQLSRRHSMCLKKITFVDKKMDETTRQFNVKSATRCMCGEARAKTVVCTNIPSMSLDSIVLWILPSLDLKG